MDPHTLFRLRHELGLVACLLVSILLQTPPQNADLDKDETEPTVQEMPTSRATKHKKGEAHANQTLERNGSSC